MVVLLVFLTLMKQVSTMQHEGEASRGPGNRVWGEQAPSMPDPARHAEGHTLFDHAAQPWHVETNDQGEHIVHVLLFVYVVLCNRY